MVIAEPPFTVKMID